MTPHGLPEEASLRITTQPHETLVATNADITTAAERWEIPDDVTYIFYLRKGVKFHSGREMTADDVVDPFDRVLGKTEAGDMLWGSKDSYYGAVIAGEVAQEGGVWLLESELDGRNRPPPPRSRCRRSSCPCCPERRCRRPPSYPGPGQRSRPRRRRSSPGRSGTSRPCGDRKCRSHRRGSPSARPADRSRSYRRWWPPGSHRAG